MRSHGDVPTIDTEAWRLTVEGLIRHPLQLSLTDLDRRLTRPEAVVTLQCAGNRHDKLVAVRPVPGEVPWGAEAISTARWGGFALADVLDASGVLAGAGHVAFEGLDAVTRRGRTFGFGDSIDLHRALNGAWHRVRVKAV